ncbi:MAG: hypothetical protein EOP04_20195, partial [Proteobacteria bacterium]
MKSISLLSIFGIFLSCTGNSQDIPTLTKKIKLKEASAIEIAPNSSLSWVIEDSGNKNIVYGLNLEGKIAHEITVSNAKNIDWEDLTSDENGNLYVGDFGNNDNTRKDLCIYKIEASSLKNDTAITLATLTQALHLDISSNGIFDGKKENAQFLFLRDQPLSDQTLRSHLASALERFIVSDRNVTQMGVHEISNLLTRTADSELAIFGNYPSTRYLASLPKLASCSVLTQERQKSLLAYPQRGTIELLCQWECTTQLRLVGLGFVASPAVALESAHMDDNTVVHAVINTKSLSTLDDRKVEHRLSMKVENSLGSTAEADVDIRVENSPPQVSLSTMPSRLAGEKSLMVSGTSDRSIKTVTLSDGLDDLSSEDSEKVFCKEEFGFHSDARSFQLNHMSDEERVHDLWLKVVDWAGNSTSQKISYARDSTPPLLHLHNGLFGSNRSPKRTAEQNENRPITIHSRLNALDEGTEDISSAQLSEIPEIRFHVSDPGRETSSLIRVEYRYSMGDQERYE